MAVVAMSVVSGCTKEDPKVASVTVSPATAEIVEGESIVMSLTILPDDAKPGTVIWSSSDKSVAEVSGNGTVSGKSAGTVTISASVDGISGHANITVTPKIIHVTGVSLDKNEIAVWKGDSFVLTATVLPEDASDKSIVWSSSSEEVAKVSENGEVTAIAAGTATITVKTNDGGKTATCSVTVMDDPHEKVQLWADGPYWATTNIGASKPEESGLYFSWGNVEGRTPEGTAFTDPFTYRNYTTTHGNSLKANIPADAEFDAARAAWNGEWRMPTDAEFRTLINYDESGKTDGGKWIADYDGTGVSGLLVTGKGEYSTCSIFLPAAGEGSGYQLFSLGERGSYWTSTLAEYYDGVAMHVRIYPDSSYSTDTPREVGCTVRPVSDK